MSQEEMKKRAAREKIGQETPGDLGRPPQGSDAVRNVGRADPLSSQLQFQATPYSVGAFPTSVAVGDFTNDGNLGIVTANVRDKTVTVLLGNGDGTFQQEYETYDVGAFPVAVAVGDFNNDGSLDIVTANFNYVNGTAFGTVAVLLGKGDGTFQTQKTYDVGAFPFAVAVGDFTNDGNLDIVTANFNYGGRRATFGQVTVLLQPVKVNTIHVTATLPFDVTVATINGYYPYVTIDWGDGSDPTTGTVTTNPDGTLTMVDGVHLYSQAGTYTLTVSATDQLRENSFQGTGTAIVSMPVQVNTIHATAQVPFSGAVAIISGRFDYDPTGDDQLGGWHFRNLGDGE